MKTRYLFDFLMIICIMFFIGCSDSDNNDNSSQTTYEEKAIAVLQSLESGDPTAVEQYASAEKYIQHNLGFPDGRQVLIDAINDGTLDGTTVDILRSFSDGDYVVLHSDYFIFGEKQVGFDVFRFEDGLIVEHWDNLEQNDGNAVSDVNGNTMLDGPTVVSGLDNTTANKALVENFVRDVLVGGSTATFDSYFNPDDGTGGNYIQHNPGFPNGTAAVKEYLQSLEAEGSSFYDKFHFVHGAGDFVLTMSEGDSVAYFDLFRVEDGKIVEHWDVIQEIPPEDQWANSNGKF